MFTIAGILETLTGLKWKIFTGLGVAGTAAALFGLALTYVENRHLTKVNASLDTEINAPGTGLNAQLAQATTNTTQLKTAIDAQRVQFEAKAASDAAALAASEARLKVAQDATAVAKKQAATVMAGAAPDNTLDDLNAIDARILETLK